jgi:hypothetical protein
VTVPALPVLTVKVQAPIATLLDAVWFFKTVMPLLAHVVVGVLNDSLAAPSSTPKTVTTSSACAVMLAEVFVAPDPVRIETPTSVGTHYLLRQIVNGARDPDRRRGDRRETKLLTDCL